MGGRWRSVAGALANDVHRSSRISRGRGLRRSLLASRRGRGDGPRAIAQCHRERFGRLDALVNNAGKAPDVRADLLEASEASFEDLIRTNLQGPYFLTQQSRE
jgi:NAD(P)-dependent dehydrogenase (short-subunit alcohol dehydrogenase family)